MLLSPLHYSLVVLMELPYRYSVAEGLFSAPTVPLYNTIVETHRSKGVRSTVVVVWPRLFACPPTLFGSDLESGGPAWSPA